MEVRNLEVRNIYVLPFPPPSPGFIVAFNNLYNYCMAYLPFDGYIPGYITETVIPLSRNSTLDLCPQLSPCSPIFSSEPCSRNSNMMIYICMCISHIHAYTYVCACFYVFMHINVYVHEYVLLHIDTTPILDSMS